MSLTDSTAFRCAKCGRVCPPTNLCGDCARKRPEFEAWAQATRPSRSWVDVGERSGDGYLDLYVQKQWEGWVAATVTGDDYCTNCSASQMVAPDGAHLCGLSQVECYAFGLHVAQKGLR